MLLFQGMDPEEDGESWMEDQWEKWLTHDFSLDEFEDDDLSEVTEIIDESKEQQDHVTSWLANSESGRNQGGRGWGQQGEGLDLELIDAGEPEEGWEGESNGGRTREGERKVEEGTGLLVRAEERRLDQLHRGGEEEEGEEEEEEGYIMDAYRPKRPTTLALLTQLAPQPRTQDTINNNSFGKKNSWKDSHSSSPHITGDQNPTEAQLKEEDKVQRNARRPAPKKPWIGAGTRDKPHTHTAAVDSHARPRDRQPPPGAATGPRAQRRGGTGRGGGAAGGRGAAGMRDRNLEESRGRNGGMGKEERRGGRLCDESRGKERERNGRERERNVKERERNVKERERSGKERERSGVPQKSRDENGLKTHEVGGRGRGAPKVVKRLDPQSPPPSQDIYLTAMVVPRTPVVSRTQDKTQDQGINNERPSQDRQTNMSRSSSEGGSNRMSLSSDTEGPPPGPLHPSLPDRTNPDISEEEGEGDQNLPVNIQNGTTQCHGVNDRELVDCTMSGGREGVLGGERGDGKAGVDHTNLVSAEGGSTAIQTVPISEAAAGLSYDSVKYTLVVDEHAQLELVSIKNCYHSYIDHVNDDSDAETVYQSANEEEDQEYEEEKKRREEERRQERRTEEERKRAEEERRRKEEEKRRVEAVRSYIRPYKVTSTTSEEEESNGGRGGAIRSKKFLNLFVNGDNQYSSAGAESFGMFSCLLDGVEREQSHRAVYRFVPRHADELDLEPDDPVLMLNQSEDLWCQGYNMRTGATGIFPAYYAVRVTKDSSKAHTDGWLDRFFVRFLGSVQVPFHKGNDVLCAAMQKIACNRRMAMQPPSACVLEITIKGLKMSVQDECHSAERVRLLLSHQGDKCFHFFQLKNISFCGCHPKYNKYFGFITKHPDQQRFACHVVISEMTSLPLAESVGRAFQQNYREHVGYSCPTEDIFIE